MTYGFRPKYGNMRAGTSYFKKKNMLPACMFLSDEFCATCAEGAVVLAATWCEVFLLCCLCVIAVWGGVIIALLGAWLFLFSWCVIVVSRWGAVFTRDGSSCCSQPLIVTDELLKATTDMSGATLVIQLSF